ncbi:MAG TPA: hypothetical protein VG028_07665 [Terriglobia bacterium]|nr:hypothetical protein [Terriglobia bacterium]
MKSIPLQVECYAGFKADERPLRFSIAGRKTQAYQVIEIADQWYGEGYQCFKVRADDGNVYILRHSRTDDGWTLDSFRRGEAKSKGIS